MDKRLNKKRLILILFTICLFSSSLFEVNANNTSGGGSAPPAGNCSTSSAGCNWSYPSNEQSFSVRLSLYKYNGNGNPAYYGSVNYCANGVNANCLTLNAYQTRDKVGKVAYQTLGKDASVWTTYGIPSKNTSVIFPTLLVDSKNGEGNWEAIERKVIEMFSFNSSSSEIVLGRVKEQFGALSSSLTTSDVGNLYITIEPAFLFNANGQYYFGTAYEIAAWLNAGGNGGAGSVTDFVYKYIPRSIVAKRTNYIDRFSFVGNLVQLTGDYISLNRDVWNNRPSDSRQNNTRDIMSKAGYGINVFWLGNYVPSSPSCTISESGNTYTLTVNNNDGSLYYDIGANKDALKHDITRNSYQASFKDQLIVGEVYNSNGDSVATCDLKRKIPTCKETCSSNDLGCMESYCQVMSSSSKEKRNCITTCGYSDPGFSGCGEKNDANGNNTVCDDSTKATLKTCTKATTSTYYKSTCTETSIIKYGNSLPVTVLPGTGFSYTPTVSGSKYCRNTFETKKWEFDYAASYTKAERDALKGILNNYNSTTSTTWTADRFKYSSSNGTNIEIEITNDNNQSASNRKTTKKLVTAQKDIDNKYEVSTEDNAPIVTMYENSNKTSKNVARAVLTNSSNRSTYQLPAVCISVGSGDIYEPTNNKCKSSSEGPYYDYYTNLKIKKDTYATITRVTKAGTALDVQNTCGYRVDLPVSCAIVEKNGIYELRIENKNNVENLRYGLSLSNNDFNGQTTYRGDITNKTLYGVVAIRDDRDDVVVATCKLEKSNVPNPTPTCNDLKSTQYDEIKKYCTTSWMNDRQGFASEKDCINYCGAGSNTCKNNPEVNNKDVNSVINFCKDSNNREAMGYDKITYASDNENDKYNEAMCINDCLDLPKSNECLGIACDYIYRPISLNDPFPRNRRSGYNWYGKEIYITDDLLNPVLNPLGAEPEYVIILNKERIDAINKNTDTYNSSKGKNAYLDYVYMDDSNKSGAYISKFIHQMDEGKGGYFNYFTGGTLVRK